MSVHMNSEIVSRPEDVATVLAGECESIDVNLYVLLHVLTSLDAGLAANPAGEGPVMILLDVLHYLLIDLLDVRSINVETDQGCSF